MQHMVSPAKEKQSTETQTNMRDVSSMVNEKATECTNTPMETDTRDNGRRTSDMVKAKWFTAEKVSIWGPGSTVNDTEKDHLSIPMEMNTLEHGARGSKMALARIPSKSLVWNKWECGLTARSWKAAGSTRMDSTSRANLLTTNLSEKECGTSTMEAGWKGYLSRSLRALT